MCAAATPARCAAPPAPATRTSSPRPAALVTYSEVSFGVRWAESTRLSLGTPNFASVSETFFMTSQSDFEPIRIPTSGFAPRHSPWPSEYPRSPSKS